MSVQANPADVQRMQTLIKKRAHFLQVVVGVKRKEALAEAAYDVSQAYT